MSTEEKVQDVAATFSLNDQEKESVKKLSDFLIEQMSRLKEIPESYEFDTVSHTITEEEELVRVDPTMILDWDSIIVGFLAAHGFLGTRNMQLTYNIINVQKYFI